MTCPLVFFQYASRRHFFSATAQAMRHLLIERARRKLRERHGGVLQRVDGDDVEIAAPTDDERLIQINTALEELALLAPEKAEVVKLRFFVGLDEMEPASGSSSSFPSVRRSSTRTRRASSTATSSPRTFSSRPLTVYPCPR
jgi:DNA-directed RNA polymerase specialized sigma24 family protein